MKRRINKDNDSSSVSNGSSSNNSDDSSDEDIQNKDIDTIEKLVGNNQNKKKTSKNKKTKHKNFDSEINAYTSEKFIKDLILIFPIDMTSIENKIANISEDYLYFYDESLERNAHLYEYIILLAKGYCRPGFVRLLTWEGLYQNELETMYSNSKRFNSMMVFIAIQQGDFEYFEKTWRGFYKALGVHDNLALSVEQKAIRMFYLLKGSTHFTSLSYLSGMKGEYEGLFRKIFTSKSKSLMYLHKLATFEEDQLLYLFKEKSKDKNIDVDIDRGLSNALIEFRKNKLHFDDDSEKWLAALTLVSFEDKSGFDYIAKQLDIPDTKSNIYKGIISLDLESITSLFDELNRDIPFDLQVLILNILKGDISALRDLIIKR